MKKKILITVAIVSILLLVSCGKKVENVRDDAYEAPTLDMDALTSAEKESEETTTVTESEATKSEVKADDEFIKEIVYSNLGSDEVKKEVIDSLEAARIDSDNVKRFIGQVVMYNETVGDVGLTKDGFVKTDKLIPEYDVMKIDEKWLAKNPEFVGYDCRMTAFLLAGDMIKVANPSTEPSSVLFMDNDAISFSGNPAFTQERINDFNTIFAEIPADLTKDVDKHVEKVKEHIKKSGISFKAGDASLISFYIHSDLDNILFVGHTGILVPSAKDDTLLFIEKVSFQEPYQVLKFKNRQELNDYLMNKYDNWIPTETARPFIMENDHLLEGYRLNPNIK